MIIWVVRMNGIQAIRPEGIIFNEEWLKLNRIAILKIPDNVTDFRYRHCGYIDYVMDGKIYSRRFHSGQEEG